MNCGQDLRRMLTPLGVYRWEGSFQWSELQSEGAALDGVEEALIRTHREMNLMTAREEGLTGWLALLARPLETGDPDRLRAALAALLRVGGNTLADMNDTLRGCGIPALVEETADPLRVVVSFPAHGGVPEGFDRMQGIIEELLPCHLQVDYLFRYAAWKDLERLFPAWSDLEKMSPTWETIGRQTV